MKGLEMCPRHGTKNVAHSYSYDRGMYLDERLVCAACLIELYEAYKTLDEDPDEFKRMVNAVYGERQ